MSFIAILLSPFLMIFKILGFFLVPLAILFFMFWFSFRKNFNFKIRKPTLPKTPTKMTPCQTSGTLIPVTEAYWVEEKCYCKRDCFNKVV